MSLLTVKNVKKVYTTRFGTVRVQALNDVNFSVEEGEYVAIIGHSGSGKSTLMNMLGCLDVPTRGKYLLHGQDVSYMTDNELSSIRNVEIGFIFQGFNLIANLTALENVELPLIYRKGVSASERRRKVEEVLERLGMSHRIRHLPTQLSGGQCQRVAIARAIVGGPQIVLADEPTGNLDSKMGAEVMALLHRLNKEDGTTVVMVTHNEEQAMQTDRIIRFFDGHIVS